MGLYNSRIVKLINKKKRLKSAVIIDELPTIYMRGLDNLIATARSNKVAVMLGFQDFSQLKRDYGDKESAVICNTVGNVFAGQVVAETAKTLSEAFRQGLAETAEHDYQPERDLRLHQYPDGQPHSGKQDFQPHTGYVRRGGSDNFDERIEQKIFHAEIVVDNEKVRRETARYVKIPQIIDFTDKDGNDTMQQQIDANYYRIKSEAGRLSPTRSGASKQTRSCRI